MNHEFYDYLRKLHLYVNEQDKRIRTLENKLQSLTNEMVSIKERAPVRVDKIEYKFDQLKVETLEGTLNIGLNPSDLQGVEDFSVQNQGMKVPYTPQEHMHRVMELEDSVYQFLESDLQQIYNDTLTKLNKNIDESYLTFIGEDIRKQIPKRIEHYLREYSRNDRSGESNEEINEKILNQIKSEIHNGVHAFINNIPDNVKGMKQE
ncbi:spore germination protein GerPC [Cytobacillus sp. FJAT-54145]|uniref:Spore germination protein GerPC n=1 Tax=Cytobacillus spartinae TaxID=3299023 RepID=A0ABW6K824_9BACI